MKQKIIDHLFSIEKRTDSFLWALGCLSLLSVLLFGLLLIGNNLAIQKPIKNIQTKNNPYEKIILEGKAAVVWDVTTGSILFSRNPDEPLPLASLTKVMTAYTAKEANKKNDRVTITEKDLSPDGDSGLIVGDSWDAGELSDFTLMTSSNDGARALAAAAMTQNFGEKEGAESLFISLMNDEAKILGLSNTKFFNEHGLDRNLEKGGAYGSARDMATLFEAVLKKYPDLLEATKYESLQFESRDKKYTGKNTNKFLYKIPNIVASKTGFTDLAGGNLVVAFDPGLNRPIIVSILGSSEEGRFKDVETLVKATMEYITQN